MPTARVLRDAAVLRRIRALVIPPAWQDVWICARADGHLQATGRDARGRKQYRYHAQWSEQRAGTKYEHLRDFAEVLPRIRRRVELQLAGADTPTRERVLATIVRLLDTTWLRIGNQRYRRDNGSHGLSTLRRRHAVVEGPQLRLSFRGKSGVRQEVAVSDRRIARIVRRCQELPGQELFCHVDANGDVHGIDSADVNAWLAQAAGCAVTAKDFRTWHGSVLALQAVLKGCAAIARGAAVRGPERPTTRRVVDQVAQQLGNTPAVCRKAYIHPAVLSLCDTFAAETHSAALLQQPWARRPGASSGLKVTERRLLALLCGGERRRARSLIVRRHGKCHAGVISSIDDGARSSRCRAPNGATSANVNTGTSRMASSNRGAAKTPPRKSRPAP